MSIYNKHNHMKLLRNICRILVGIVFIYSGFVKGVDPLGSDYKFTDYFNAFGMSWMGFSTLFFSFLLSMADFLIGICLFLNIKIKTAAWGAILFMGFFTPLTLILAIKNPVTDCGCFGDALILTNWETFWKNIILLAMTLVIFYTRDKYKPIFNFLEQTVVLVGTVIFMFCVQWYSFRHLPIVDFRPYAIGKNISEGMAIPANRQQLAVALWTAAGKPATQSTALFNDVAADAAELQAIRWVVDTGLMSAQDGSFKPGSRVGRMEVIRTWKTYQQRG